MKWLFVITLFISALIGCKSGIDEPVIPVKEVTITSPKGGEIFKDSITIKGRIKNFDESPVVEILVNKSIVEKIYSVDSTFSAKYLIPKSGDTTQFTISARAVVHNSFYFSNPVTVYGVTYKEPYNLRVQTGSATGVKIVWETRFNNFDYYIIERRTNNESFKEIARVNEEEYLDEEIDTKNEYSYRVRAVKEDYITSPSKVITVASVIDDIEELPPGPALPVNFIRRFVYLKQSDKYVFLSTNKLYIIDGNGSLLNEMPYPSYNINAIDYSSNKNIFLTYSSNKYIDIWDANTIAIIDSFYLGTSLKYLKLSTTGDTLFTISYTENSISVYDLISRSLIQVLTKKGEDVIQSVKLLQGKVLAAAERREYVNFYFLDNNFDHQWLDLGNVYIGDIAFSLDGKELLATSTNRLYFASTGYSNLRITKAIDLEEASAVNSAFYLPGNKSLALVGNVLMIYSLIDNLILVKKEINSLYSQIDGESMKLIVPVSNYFTFYKLKRHWIQISK